MSQPAEIVETFLSVSAAIAAVDDLHGEHYRMLHAEIAELRDGLVALSNRVEAVTHAVNVRAGNA
jgi:hypothetical protein